MTYSVAPNLRQVVLQYLEQVAYDRKIVIECRGADGFAIDTTVGEFVREFLGEPKSPEGKQWEYKRVAFASYTNYILNFNDFGSKGWELVQCDFKKEMALFKRPK